MKIIGMEQAFDNGVEDATSTPKLAQATKMLTFGALVPVYKKAFETETNTTPSYVAQTAFNAVEKQPELIIRFTMNKDLSKLTEQLGAIMGKMNEQVYHVLVGVGNNVKTSLLIGRCFHIGVSGDKFGRMPKLVFSDNKWAILNLGLNGHTVEYIFPDNSPAELVLQYCQSIFASQPKVIRNVDITTLKTSDAKFIEFAKELTKEPTVVDSIVNTATDALSTALAGVKNFIAPKEEAKEEKPLYLMSKEEAHEHITKKFKEEGFKDNDINALIGQNIINPQEYASVSNYNSALMSAFKKATGQTKTTTLEDVQKALVQEDSRFEEAQYILSIDKDGNRKMILKTEIKEPEQEEIRPLDIATLDIGETLKTVYDLTKIPEAVANVFKEGDVVRIGVLAGAMDGGERFQIPYSDKYTIIHTVNVKILSGMSLFGEIGSYSAIKNDPKTAGYIVYKETDGSFIVIRVP
jgi:hypothetical protein